MPSRVIMFSLMNAFLLLEHFLWKSQTVKDARKPKRRHSPVSQGKWAPEREKNSPRFTEQVRVRREAGTPNSQLRASGHCPNTSSRHQHLRPQLFCSLAVEASSLRARPSLLKVQQSLTDLQKPGTSTWLLMAPKQNGSRNSKAGPHLKQNTLLLCTTHHPPGLELLLLQLHDKARENLSNIGSSC